MTKILVICCLPTACLLGCCGCLLLPQPAPRSGAGPAAITKIDYEGQIMATDSVHEKIRLFEEWMRHPSTGTDSSRHRRMAVHDEIRWHLSRHNLQWFDTELAKLEERRQAPLDPATELAELQAFLGHADRLLFVRKDAATVKRQTVPLQQRAGEITDSLEVLKAFLAIGAETGPPLTLNDLRRLERRCRRFHRSNRHRLLAVHQQTLTAHLAYLQRTIAVRESRTAEPGFSQSEQLLTSILQEAGTAGSLRQQRQRVRQLMERHEGRLDQAHEVQLRELVTALEIAARETPEPAATDDGWRRTLAKISRNAKVVADGSEDIVQLFFDIGQYTLQNRLRPHHRIPRQPVEGYYDSEGRYVKP
ncbi:MAG: hypothetical protein QGF67_03580 [Lentisphaeria bacterium]|jgi:hypothetical protein|nr:hypothetical protein [Lentisphaeria bacterium]